MDIYFSPEAKSNIRRMTDEANAAAAAYGPCDEVVDMLRSTLNVINQVIQLGGRITGGDESMPLNGSNEFIAYGVARHSEKIPAHYYESACDLFLTGQDFDEATAKADEYVADMRENGYIPICRTYGVHS
jgi:hypothetical protein